MRAYVKKLVAAASLVVALFVMTVTEGATTAQAQTAGSGAAQTAGSGAAEAGSSDWRQVSAGGVHTCGIRRSGRLYCWGYDAVGQLGNGGANSDASTPVQVAGGGTNWASVSAGSVHTCARKTDGRLYCWGYDGNGRLGNGGANSDASTPVQVAGGASNWATVSAGDEHTCARKTNGRLFCWGKDVYGQLGNGGANADRTTPAQVAGGATNWASVSAGFNHTCARKTNGRLFCWGYDNNGQLGNGGANADRTTPAQVAGGATNWASVSAGGAHTCARKTNRRLFRWGWDGNGQLGDNATLGDRTTPAQVAGGATNWRTVDGGGAHTCGRKTNGRLYCWGSDLFGQLGDNAAIGDRATPVQVAGGATDWRIVDAGGGHTCARTSTGRLFCWGGDVNGQVGDNPTFASQPTPVEVYVP